MALLYLSLPLRGQRMRRPFRLLVDVVSLLSECRQAVTHALYRMFMGVGTGPADQAAAGPIIRQTIILLYHIISTLNVK